MKNKYLLGALALVLVLVGIGSSVAYFNAQDSAKNVFTVGNIDIDLVEESWNPDEDHVIGPNVSFDKDPVVKNEGDNSAYVRLSVKVSNYSILKEASTDPEFQPSDLFTGYDASNWTPVNEAPDPEEDDTITYTYYYNKVLEPGQSTEPIFTKITFPDLSMHVIDSLESNLEITVWADAIQSDGFSTVEEAFAAFDGQA